MKVPFNDLAGLHKSLRKEIDAVFNEVLTGSGFVLSNLVSDFENAFANKLGVKHCIGVGNGTDALIITLKMLGLSDGDEVILPANSFVASAEAVCLAGGKPVFVDHDRFFTIDTYKIEDKITPQTKAIIPVHLYGQPANISPIQKICNRFGLWMVEDCAQSHFSTYHNNFTGTFGDAACFSFYPGKNLGALGDGGCIVTNNDDLAERVRMFRDHGSLKQLKHQIIGCNSRLDGLQAAVLNLKLKYIDEWNRKRFDIALRYLEKLKDCKYIQLPELRNDSSHIFHLFVIKAQDRDKLAGYLSEKQVQTGVHYHTAIPFLPAFAHLQYKPIDFAVSYSNMSKLITLPLFPNMSTEQTNYVAECILEFYSKQ